MSQIGLFEDVAVELVPINKVSLSKKQAFPVNLAEPGRFVRDHWVIFDGDKVQHKSFDKYREPGKYPLVFWTQEHCLKLWRSVTAGQGSTVEIKGLNQADPPEAVCVPETGPIFGLNVQRLKAVMYLCSPTGYRLSPRGPVVAYSGQIPVAAIATIKMEEC